MKLQENFQKVIGTRMVGVKLNGLQLEDYRAPAISLRFCEAVASSMISPIAIHEKNIDCVGALRSFGFYRNDIKLATLISKESGIPVNFIQKAINEIPVMKCPVRNMILGSIDNPDVLIAFVEPEKATQLMMLYASYYEEYPIIYPSFFMSVCGNIVARVYNTNKICISFGCPESRKYGGVLPDEIVVGIPGNLLKF